MYKANCAKCGQVFTIEPWGTGAFCLGCVRELQGEAREAETYQKQINSGSVNVRPENEADRQRVKAAIRKRLSNSTRDCTYKHST
ncbi:MAG: hypothetical protein IIB77_06570 [Proteobacteria bacterium]|nr:hypothetical protein [Pseudomonadota bacterium]